MACEASLVLCPHFRCPERRSAEGEPDASLKDARVIDRDGGSKRRFSKTLKHGAPCVTAFLLAGCTVGPNYHAPVVSVPSTYKELPRDWKIAAPHDDADRGPWWSIYHDPVLDQLEQQVDINNQSLKASEAAHRKALALVREARSELFPSVVLPSQNGVPSPGIERVHENGATATEKTVSVVALWDLDIWGKIRRQIESQRAEAQASAADLASLRLSTQAELATDYFQLRFEDSLQQLLGKEVTALNQSLQIVRNQYRFGAAVSSDVAAAETQLQTVQAELIAIGVDRSKYEHAIALLIGQTPAAVGIPAAALPDGVPDIPVVLPSHLLERRPDVAAAEREMQSQNARIGVAIAAYYPDISLGAAFGYSGVGALFRSANQLWGIAGSVSGTLLDAGGRSGSVAAARAAYEQSEANYRQTTLSAFREVEDALSALHVLGQQASAEAAALASARRSAETALLAYRAGAQAYTAVVTAQLSALSNEQTVLQVQEARLVSSVALLKALGGGWQVSDLDS